METLKTKSSATQLAPNLLFCFFHMLNETIKRQEFNEGRTILSTFKRILMNQSLIEFNRDSARVLSVIAKIRGAGIIFPRIRASSVSINGAGRDNLDVEAKKMAGKRTCTELSARTREYSRTDAGRSHDRAREDPRGPRGCSTGGKARFPPLRGCPFKPYVRIVPRTCHAPLPSTAVRVRGRRAF